ncbi:gamma-glutamylcyclotransferase [Achromobacter insolitus]|uniref:glutathione-specific gamma-glutamylcyclotransferase n=1 Tax=Achromobacter insolitus TaxID=217204 RepID=A0A6S7EVM7_9BURK|nr:gamma-glutamylcyclotransferase [Achromobacter insolitus]CAB3929385.1 Glutathione-specific gamma-glutamylcyclotransferase [Achromobacter insolitus]CAB3944907.1 Glutathione-specific gamma-glutamylcyclotransferase [Achromobacter insolitus]
MNSKAIMTLTRELLDGTTFAELVNVVEGGPHWTQEELDRSMNDTLEHRTSGEPVWLFAYGSLIWNPVIEFEEHQTAMLLDWHRSFCIRLLAGRGTPQLPGRMLGLLPGGECGGVALRLSEHNLRDELRLVWMREMIHGLYRPIWAKVRLSTGEFVRAITFVANTASNQYEHDPATHSAAAAIARACGSLGTNREYLSKLNQALDALGMQDKYVTQMAAVVDACSSDGEIA